MRHPLLLATLTLGLTTMINTTMAAPLDPSTDPQIDAPIRAFLTELNKDPTPFWEFPQPKPQEILVGLQNKTAVDISGVTTVEKTVTQDGLTVKLYIMTPERLTGKPGVLLFIHGGVWIVGNFENHKRLLRDLVVGSGQVGVFVENTPLPAAKFPTQLDESYAALKWIVTHAGDFGADGTRIAVAGNSVGGDMSAALTLMTKDRKGPKISYQVLFIPATDASVDTDSYHQFATGRFLSREFMKYGWDRYATDEKTRNNPYVSPLRATKEQLTGLPPALVITAENDPLRDEGEAYARKLKEAGVDVTAVRFNGTIHDFVLLNALRHLPSTESAIGLASAGIRRRARPWRAPTSISMRCDCYSVRCTRLDFSRWSRSRKLSRTWAKRRGGRGPYAIVEASRPGRGRRSGPGHTNSFASVITIQERSASRPRRLLVSVGISTASMGLVGGVCVIGRTRTSCSPSSSVTTNTTAHGGSFIRITRPAYGSGKVTVCCLGAPDRGQRTDLELWPPEGPQHEARTTRRRR